MHLYECRAALRRECWGRTTGNAGNIGKPAPDPPSESRVAKKLLALESILRLVSLQFLDLRMMPVVFEAMSLILIDLR